MKIYTLVGKSGTGKSYQALSLCKDLNIEAIIDDGLFIFHSQVVAGISAKRQNTTIGAIKTALFRLDKHRDAVLSAIKRVNPNSILIIGTSDRMVERIIARLNLPEPLPQNQIKIEDLTTEEERELASKQRHAFGKHVIPVPTLQLKRDFAGYFMNPLQVFRDLQENIGQIPGITGTRQPRQSQLPSEKSRKKKDKRAIRRDLTVVRPTYSYVGDFFISDKVVTDIARCVGRTTLGIKGIAKVYGNTSIDFMHINVAVLIDKNVDPFETAEIYQKKLFEMIEQMTAFNIEYIKIDVRGIRSPYAFFDK